jgi:hypothetical protein
MTEDPALAANDAWQTAFHEVAYRFSVALKEFQQTNPWPETQVLAPAINLLATELWDRGFSLRPRKRRGNAPHARPCPTAF